MRRRLSEPRLHQLLGAGKQLLLGDLRRVDVGENGALRFVLAVLDARLALQHAPRLAPFHAEQHQLTRERSELDAVGTLQTKEKSTGVAIDTTADIVIDGTTMHITGPLDLMQKVAASKMAQHRYAQLLTSFMFEREDANDCGTINDLAAKIAPGGYTIQSLITDLTQTPQFRTRAAGVM